MSEDGNGWIKSHRRTLDNPVICKDSDHLAVWMFLLWKATHQSKDSLFCGKRITLNPGQLITGRKVISDKFNISESKVQRILKTFEVEQQIEQQTASKSRLISVLNWSKYQSREQQSEQQVNNKFTGVFGVEIEKTPKSEQQVKGCNIDWVRDEDSSTFKSEQQANNKRTTSEQQSEHIQECINKNDKNKIKEIFEEFRKIYPGKKYGLNTEFERFAKHRDYKEAVHLLKPAIEQEKREREEAKKNGVFYPAAAYLQTWINQRRWECESGETSEDPKRYLSFNDEEASL